MKQEKAYRNVSMVERIVERLQKMESKYDVKILLAVESGSRAWGFASKDSDYDVRFIYVHRKEWYLTLVGGRDVIEELDPDGVMDFAGWDLKKALLLMGKGNCAFAEWLNSPIIYYKDEDFFQSISLLKEEYFRKVSAVNHYYHMAINHDKRYLEKRGYELKRFMYHLRGILAAKWSALNGTYPPVLFSELVERMIPDEKIKTEINILVALKKEGSENNCAIVNDSLIRYAAETASNIESMLGSFPDDKPQNYKRLDEFFLSVLDNVPDKATAYKNAQIAQGRNNNANEVIPAGLRMLEVNDIRIAALRSAIEEGVNSGEAVDFDPAAHLKSLKASKRNA